MKGQYSQDGRESEYKDMRESMFSDVTFSPPRYSEAREDLSRSMFTSLIATKPSRTEKISMTEMLELESKRITRMQSSHSYCEVGKKALLFLVLVVAVISLIFLINSNNDNEDNAENNDEDLLFQFDDRNQLEILCDESLVSNNEVHFASCIDGSIFVCVEVFILFGFRLETVVCPDFKNICSCPNGELFKPQIGQVLSSVDVCRAIEDSLPEVCSSTIDQLNFDGTRVSLKETGIFGVAAEECQREQDSFQACVHPELKVECDDGDLELKKCRGDEICKCSLFELIDSTSDICASLENTENVCQQSENEINEV